MEVEEIPVSPQSADDAESFVRSGEELVVQLQRELGDLWHVEYMPEPIRPPGLRLRNIQ